MKLSKKIKTCFALAAAFLSGGTGFASAFDIEVPLSFNFAKTQAEYERNYLDTYFLMFPIAFFKPLKIEYVFLPEENPSKWTFAAGTSFSVWPYQFLGACGKASYQIASFKNGSTLEAAGSVDAGIFGKISSYFNTIMPGYDRASFKDSRYSAWRW